MSHHIKDEILVYLWSKSKGWVGDHQLWGLVWRDPTQIEHHSQQKSIQDLRRHFSSYDSVSILGLGENIERNWSLPHPQWKSKFFSKGLLCIPWKRKTSKKTQKMKRNGDYFHWEERKKTFGKGKNFVEKKPIESIYIYSIHIHRENITSSNGLRIICGIQPQQRRD